MRSPKSGTCIAAIKNKRGKILIAADRRMSWDFSQAQVMPNPKVVKKDGLVLAGTGSCYLLNLLSKVWQVPSRNDVDVDMYMYNMVHASINKLLCNKGLGDKEKHLKLPPDLSVEAIIACDGRLYSVVIENMDGDNSNHSGIILIDEVNLPYASGCGGQLAWGSLLTTEKLKMSPKERLTLAIEAAATVSPGCDNNIDIVQED